MNWSNIICIEVSKYNETQLEKLSSELGIIPNVLFEAKKTGTLKVYWDKTKPYFIACLERKELHDKYDKPLYKGLLILNSEYSTLTKKDKDRLLKLEAFNFSNKNKTKVSTTINKDSNINKESQEVFEIDAILDKIIDLGMDSLTKNELNFLNQQSKK